MNDNITNRYSVRHNPPTKGTRVRIYDIDVHSDYEGHEATVTDMSVDASMCYAEVKSIQKPDDTLQVRFASYEEIAAPEPDVDALKLAVAALTAEKERLERELNDARATISQAHTAVQMIGDALIAEADRRNFCEEYDQLIDDINESLPGPFALPEREQEYEIEVTGNASVSWSHTVTVRARSADHACDMVQMCPSDYIDIDQVANDSLNYGYGWDSNEIEDVTEA